MKLKVDIDPNDVADEVSDALTEGIDHGLDESMDWLLRQGTEEARDRVRATDRVWREKLYYGFSSKSSDSVQGDFRMEGYLTNTAPHAEVVEEGLDPGTRPPIQNIIPWVKDKLHPSSVSGRDWTNWDPELEKLANKYGPGYVLTAFKVQEHLYNEGYPGIGYMETAERFMQRSGPMVVRRKVESAIERELRIRGLK